MILYSEGLTQRRKSARPYLRLLFIIQLSIASLLFAFDGSVVGQDESDPDTVRVRTDLVTVPAFVLDNKGRRVTGLSATDFEVRDNGHIVGLEYFVTGTERVAMVFALDASGSTRDVITQQRDLALALFLRFGHGSEVAVIQFADTAQLVSPFSSDRADVVRAFVLPTLANRHTAIFDAVSKAVRAFDSRRDDVTERRIVILISDGLDTVSVLSADQVVAEAKTRGVSVYAIQIPLYSPRDGRLRPRPATKGFRALAEKSGGRFFMVGSDKAESGLRSSYDLSAIFLAIEEDLHGQYVLGYYPAVETLDGRFHRIEVEIRVKDKHRLRAHSFRDGYYSKQ